nr:hypothetical protein [uncultured Pseudogulbenkiania sp.]
MSVLGRIATRSSATMNVISIDDLHRADRWPEWWLSANGGSAAALFQGKDDCMSTRYAGYTLAEIKEAATTSADDGTPVPTNPAMLLDLIGRIEELERAHDTAWLAGFKAAQEMAARQCDTLAEEFYSAAAIRCASSVRAMQPSASWEATTSEASDRHPLRPAETEWPHPDGFPAIAGMP